MKYLYIPFELIEPFSLAGIDIGNATHLPTLLRPNVLSSIVSPHDVAYYYGVNQLNLVPLPEPVTKGLKSPFLYTDTEFAEFSKVLQDEINAFKINKPSITSVKMENRGLVPSLLGDDVIVFAHIENTVCNHETDFYYTLMTLIRSVKSIDNIGDQYPILKAYFDCLLNDN